MATALDIIKRSMRLVKALGSGETPNNDEQTDGLTALNDMLDSWSIQNLAIYQIQDESFTWSSGQTTRTMGDGGDFDTDRPIEIEGVFQRLNDIDYPIQKATQQQYSAIPDKTTQSTIVTWLYPDMAYPLATLYAWPVPSQDVTVHIQSWKPLQSFSAASTEVSLPPGYREAITYNLAVRLADEYEKAVPPSVFRRAASGLRTIKQRNNRTPNAVVEPAYMSHGLFDWRVGD